MKDSKNIVATRKMLLRDGSSPEEVEAMIDVIKIKEKYKKIDSFRSWAAVVISGLAMVISVVALFK